jgi:hypothetical protein
VAADQAQFMRAGKCAHAGDSGIFSHNWRTSMLEKMVINTANAA